MTGKNWGKELLVQSDILCSNSVAQHVLWQLTPVQPLTCCICKQVSSCLRVSGHCQVWCGYLPEIRLNPDEQSDVRLGSCQLVRLGLWTLDGSSQQQEFRRAAQAGARSCQTSPMPRHLTTFQLPWKFEKHEWWIYSRLNCVRPPVRYASILYRGSSAVSISQSYLLLHSSCRSFILYSWNMNILFGRIDKYYILLSVW